MDFFKVNWLRPAPDPKIQQEIFDLIEKAGKESDERHVLELTNALVKNGQSANFSTEYGGKTPLHLAARYGLRKTVVSLVSAHADIERRDMIEFSAIHYAIMEGHKEIVRCLRDLGASTETSLKGSPALHLAFYYGRRDVVEFLLDINKRLDEEDDSHRTPIALASASTRTQISEAWIMEKMIYHLDLKKSNGSEFLVCAAEAGYRRIVRYLIDKLGVDVNTTRKNGQTALMIACYCHLDYEEHYKNMVEMLLRRSIHVDTQDMNGNTALHFASGNGAPKLVKTLIESGANPGLLNKNNQTPLDLARRSGCKEAERILK
jgi:ankyrin repeat protein